MNMDSLMLAKAVAEILDAKKAENINVIRITSISLARRLLCHRKRHEQYACACAGRRAGGKLKAAGRAPARVEGYRSNSWIILDYEEVVVHLFTADAREFYDLDRLWADGEKLEIEFKPN